jgi:cytochrome c oxidase subunit IV
MTETAHKHPNYAAVFWALLVLTILEVVAANSPFEKFAIVLVLVFLAIVKAALVGLFYMHLKYEKYIFYLIVFFPLLLAVILTVMVLSDRSIA